MNPACPFQIHRAGSHEAMSLAATARLEDQLRRKPDSLLILASGRTPERAYQLLAGRGQAEPELCARLRILKLDEWGGLSMNDPATCEVALRQALVDPLGMGSDRFVAWRSAPSDIAGECKRIGRWLENHGPADSTAMINVYYKDTHLKLYQKEGRALRTETTINNTCDFQVGKRHKNLAALRQLGFRANRRVLEAGQLTHDAHIGAQAFDQLQKPAAVDGQHASALPFGQERGRALLMLLVLFCR